MQNFIVCDFNILGQIRHKNLFPETIQIDQIDAVTARMRYVKADIVQRNQHNCV